MHIRYCLASLLIGSITTLAYAHAATEAPLSRGHHQASRIDVVFPASLKRQTLSSMRKHLQGLAEIQQALADRKFGEAAEIATMTLGMSSMHGDQMAEEAKYMPRGMRKMGALMHQRAAEFALSAQDASATGDVRPPLRALSRLTETCVACHAVYRLR